MSNTDSLPAASTSKPAPTSAAPPLAAPPPVANLIGTYCRVVALANGAAR